MIPSERSLVLRLKGQPFALIGINSDSDREALKGVMEREGIIWPSFWDGGTTTGPIAKRWNVREWPTIYILDAKGTIRFKNLRDEELGKAVDTLLAEMKSGTTEK